jgi:hypothetical protein
MTPSSAGKLRCPIDLAGTTLAITAAGTISFHDPSRIGTDRSGFGDFGSMKNAATQELYSYWDTLRGARVAPERADIDPGAIRGVLADTFVLDVCGEASLSLRISGARVNALFLNEMKGMDFLQLWDTSSRNAVRDLAANVSSEPTPAIAGVRTAPPGRPVLDLELLLLPLRHFGRTHSRILGCLTPSAVPLWLGLIPVESLSLGPMRIIRGAAADGLKSTLENENRSPERYGHLRVHNGGNSQHNTTLQDLR